MDETTKSKEQTYLSEIVQEVTTAKKDLENKLEAVGKENLDRLSDLRSNQETGTDFEMFLEQLHEKNQAFDLKSKIQRIDELNYLSSNPYFARIDLKTSDDSKTESVYIGKFGLTNNDPVITDWRAGIASIYYRYRYPQKNVEYKTPGGNLKTNLLLKRTYDIFQGQLVKYYNNDIQFDENDIIIDKVEKRTGGVLEDIVETIQKDQLDIIEADPRQVCIVQGCVGSGKSTVAIHKLAHIFFHFGNYIHAQRSILVVKNQILVGYLSTLFPKLGIFDINFKAFRDLVVNAIFREGLSIKYDLNIESKTEVDLSNINEIYKSIESVHLMIKQKIEGIFSNPDYESFGGFKYSSNITPYQNLSEISEDLLEELKSQQENLKDNPNSIRSLIIKSNIRTIKNISRKIGDLKRQLKNSILSEILAEHDINSTNKMDYQETLYYLFVYARVIGFLKFPPYEYCVLDEGQDFNVLELAVLDMFVLRGRFAIFGDLNQGIFSDSLKSWDTVKQVIPEAKQASVFSLNTNYRSTKPIIDLANKILSPYTKSYLPKSLNRAGPKPSITKVDTHEEILVSAKHQLIDDIKSLSKSIGVICFDKKLKEASSKMLGQLDIPKNEFIELDETQRIKYLPQGIYLMDVEESKGLEFSKVYVLGLNTDKISDMGEARRAFVAVTRAMSDLVVIGQK